MLETDFSAFDGMAGIVVAVYILAVLYQGNLATIGANNSIAPGPLLSQLTQESGFLEFLIAVFILKWLASRAATSSITYGFIALAVLGALLKAANNMQGNTAVSDFLSGKAGILDTLKNFTGVK